MLFIEGKVNKQLRESDMTSALLRLYCLLRQEPDRTECVLAAIKAEASDTETYNI